ncbi:hypothetical protein P872_15180 [Rhodonellum psychrophilum GCM71 = DSM 17998]|uniref:Uncharacterized protein n=1 Tax=Rhodonellum psychrophilum GCM71 = DSM 17998 TaxID=1123057 RepID=U5C636_9BACT|nr:hypothetical protein P872_15180 [Rhodonellum psychrophilum GCM71 = DSM 17998]
MNSVPAQIQKKLDNNFSLDFFGVGIGYLR